MVTSTLARPWDLRRFAEDVREFAEALDVIALMSPWEPLGPATGIELTDLFATTPGQGSGTKVMKLIVEIADEMGVSVYIFPSSARNREFYGRFGFVPAFKRSSALVRFPPLPEDWDE